MGEDGAPARHDLRPLKERRVAGMQADYGSGRRPQRVHRLEVALVEGAVKGAIGGEHRLTLVVVELDRGWEQRRASRHVLSSQRPLKTALRFSRKALTASM